MAAQLRAAEQALEVERAQHQVALEQAKAEHRAAVGAVTADAAESKERAASTAAATLEAARAEHDEVVRRLAATHRHELEELRGKLQEARLAERMARQKGESRAAAAKQLVDAEAAKRERAVEEAVAVALRERAEGHDRELADAHAEELAAARADGTAQVRTVTTELLQQCERLRATHEAEMAAQSKAHAEAVQRLQSSHMQALAATKARHDADKKRALDEARAREAELVSDKQRLMKRLTAMREEAQGDTERLQKQYVEAVRDAKQVRASAGEWPALGGRGGGALSWGRSGLPSSTVTWVWARASASDCRLTFPLSLSTPHHDHVQPNHPLSTTCRRYTGRGCRHQGRH